ncbi:hypothetical protein JXA12_02225 [Candidatus Woesearchaeota archaeon]|nr:hypothetical protein [Candidatus Woesearchaeota archaeon]
MRTATITTDDFRAIMQGKHQETDDRLTGKGEYRYDINEFIIISYTHSLRNNTLTIKNLLGDTIYEGETNTEEDLKRAFAIAVKNNDEALLSRSNGDHQTMIELNSKKRRKNTKYLKETKTREFRRRRNGDRDRGDPQPVKTNRQAIPEQEEESFEKLTTSPHDILIVHKKPKGAYAAAPDPYGHSGLPSLQDSSEEDPQAEEYDAISQGVHELFHECEDDCPCLYAPRDNKQEITFAALSRWYGRDVTDDLLEGKDHYGTGMKEFMACRCGDEAEHDYAQTRANQA